MKDMTIAAYQMEILTGEKEKNIAKIEKVLHKYQNSNSKLLVLPELFTTGFVYGQFEKLAEEIDNSSTIETLVTLSSKYGIGVAGSILTTENQDNYFNLGIIISPTKGLVYKYKKVHLWGTEKEHFAAGNEIPLPVDFEGLAKVGLAICYDLRFPEVYRKHAVNGAEVLLTSAAWPVQRRDHFYKLSAARALENTCYHIAVNRIGEEHNPVTVEYNGYTAVFDPTGDELIKSPFAEESFEYTITAEKLEKTRKQIPVLKDRKFEI